MNSFVAWPVLASRRSSMDYGALEWGVPQERSSISGRNYLCITTNLAYGVMGKHMAGVDDATSTYFRLSISDIG